jgi:hypothetical protein
VTRAPTLHVLGFVGGLVASVACAAPGPQGTAMPEAATIGQPPSAPPFEPALRARLAAALAARGPGYQPRTHHLREDGSPKYTNRLILESSPYLLQHAHNPVDWYPWGDEAFAVARRLGRPVLLSIGYSTCHWCHVMERESFEDEEIAAYLNAHYVAIKVDREERPDVDAVYMTAVQALTGHGGWPMTTWLTHDREPFFGGTYFPARDGDRGARTGFLTLLAQLRQTFDADAQGVAEQAREIAAAIRRRLEPNAAGALPGGAAVAAAVASYRRSFDPVHGGLGRAPKFPSSLPVRLLLRHHHRTGDGDALEMAVRTLEAMAAGGIHDQVGGGFHRYATDERWLVPHFEKTLYDNALLALAYLEGWQATGRADFAAVAADILRYVAREMTAPEGGFHSATDADSLTPAGEMEEGWFFTWTPQEIEAALGAEEARLFQAFYTVTPSGNFEGRNIPHVTRPHAEVARRLGVSEDRLRASLAAARDALYRARLARPAPLRDDKILTSWNGLMIAAFARGGFVLDDPELTRRARAAARFVLDTLVRDGRLLRSYRDGQARHNGYLDDYAFLIAGLVDLYETTFEIEWLRHAIALQAALDEHHADEAGGGYFMTSDDHETLLARERPFHDGAEPSGNSVALANLLRLHALTTDDRYRARADRLLGGFARTIGASSEMLLALEFRLGDPREIVLVVPRERREAAPFLDVLRRTYLPSQVVALAVEGADLAAQAATIPLLAGKVARDGQATAYVCQGGVCRLPATDVETFAAQLRRPAARPGGGERP